MFVIDAGGSLTTTGGSVTNDWGTINTTGESGNTAGGSVTSSIISGIISKSCLFLH